MAALLNGNAEPMISAINQEKYNHLIVDFSPEYQALQYPNPSSKDFTIQFSQKDLNDKKVLLQVYDVFGKIQVTEEVELVNGTFTKEIHHSLSDGIYMLRICTSSGCNEKNLMVMH